MINIDSLPLIRGFKLRTGAVLRLESVSRAVSWRLKKRGGGALAGARIARLPEPGFQPGWAAAGRRRPAPLFFSRQLTGQCRTAFYKAFIKSVNVGVNVTAV